MYLSHACSDCVSLARLRRMQSGSNVDQNEFESRGEESKYEELWGQVDRTDAACSVLEMQLTASKRSDKMPGKGFEVMCLRDRVAQWEVCASVLDCACTGLLG